jgi:hypothetical protein
MIHKSTIATTTLLIAGSLIGLAPSIARGDEHSALNIADNDSVYVDGKSFQIISGKAKGNATAQIVSLGARDLGPAAIIIRSGSRLYIADTQSQAAVARIPMSFAYDPQAYTPSVLGAGSYGHNNTIATNYAYDPRTINPALSGGGSAGYNQGVATNYAYDPRTVNPTLSGGGSAGYNQGVATNYAYDPRTVNPALSGGGSAGYNQSAVTNYAYDPQAYPIRNPNPWVNNYAYDPRTVNPVLSGGGSAGYNQGVATNYAYDPRAYPIRNPDPWANNYAYDPRVPAAQPSVIYDADYVEYRLKKAFEDNWTPMGTPTATK